jgi:hypothetical protein
MARKKIVRTVLLWIYWEIAFLMESGSLWKWNSGIKFWGTVLLNNWLIQNATVVLNGTLLSISTERLVVLRCVFPSNWSRTNLSTFLQLVYEFYATAEHRNICDFCFVLRWWILFNSLVSIILLQLTCVFRGLKRDSDCQPILKLRFLYHVNSMMTAPNIV